MSFLHKGLFIRRSIIGSRGEGIVISIVDSPNIEQNPEPLRLEALRLEPQIERLIGRQADWHHTKPQRAFFF